MFFIRYRLHRQIYNHKACKAMELLLVKLLFEIEKEHKISEYILEPEKMIKLIDSYIWNYSNDNINEIIKNINERNIPKMIYQNISLQPNNSDIDINKLINKFGNDKFEIVQFKVGYVSGKSANPLNNITFYNSKTYKIISENKVRSFSLLINQKYQEYFYRIYCLDLSLIENFKEYINEISKKENKQLEQLEQLSIIELLD